MATDIIGSLWCVRSVAFADPELEQTRLLAAAADQVAQAVARERLSASAADAEIARRSEELRSALLDSVSHDLRTPLATIRAAAGSLADPAIALNTTERHALARSIDLEADRMNRLVATLLDMSRVQAGALVPDLVVYPVRALVEPVVERMRSELSGHPLTVDVPLDLPSVHADGTLLTQALTNLIENAVRHTPTGTTIAIRAVAASGRLRLVVEDGGPGVTPDALGRLFERFYRGPAALPRVRRGMGLGLTVVRGMVEAMGGTVSAARGNLGGLAVTIDLPASDVA
jgi:two-component system sensor histidine kinase KdpD